MLKAISKRFITSDEEKKEDATVPNFLADEDLGPKVADVIEEYSSKLLDDSFLKIIRQLEFWYDQNTLEDDEYLALAKRLCSIASWRSEVEDESVPEEKKFKIPKVRYGKTELQMPIVTCGGMRLQETWIPDIVPLIGPNKKKVVKGSSQDNLREVILDCIKIGLNHFETARFYGSSEVQFVDALVGLMNEGKIQRSDFIFQTKLFCTSEKQEDFKKQWEASWSNVEKLEYVDLFSFHCLSDDKQVEILMSDAEDSVYAFALNLQKEGKIKHIGFSTHGSAENIMKLINTEKFSYVNVHRHFFGDYHAQGTIDSVGGHGNAAAVKRALELDMGVFQISPCDKGGKLYRPSATVATTIGPELSPIAFATLHAWKTLGMHTTSVGFARPSDLDEVIEAARLYSEEGDRVNGLLKAAEDRLKDLAIEKLGKDWYEKGLLNLPSCYTKSTDGIAIGHVLWLHNCLTAYGMHEFCSDRYKMLVANKAWSKSKSFEENSKKNFNPGNAGRQYDESIDLTEALKDHYDPELVKSKLAECHKWLNSSASISDAEKADRGWKQAYNLTTWEEFPGEAISVQNVLLNRVGLKDVGPSKETTKDAQQKRAITKLKSTRAVASAGAQSDEKK